MRICAGFSLALCSHAWECVCVCMRIALLKNKRNEIGLQWKNNQNFSEQVGMLPLMAAQDPWAQSRIHTWHEDPLWLLPLEICDGIVFFGSYGHGFSACLSGLWLTIVSFSKHIHSHPVNVINSDQNMSVRAWTERTQQQKYHLHITQTCVTRTFRSPTSIMPTLSKSVPDSLHRQYGCVKIVRLSGITSVAQTVSTRSSISWRLSTLFAQLVLHLYKKQLSATKIELSSTSISNGCINVCCWLCLSTRCFETSVSIVCTYLNKVCSVHDPMHILNKVFKCCDVNTSLHDSSKLVPAMKFLFLSQLLIACVLFLFGDVPCIGLSVQHTHFVSFRSHTRKSPKAAEDRIAWWLHHAWRPVTSDEIPDSKYS